MKPDHSQASVTTLAIHPIKSTQPISLDKVFVESKGMAFDRRFVLIDDQDKAITARTHGTLTQVNVTLLEKGLVVKAPNMAPLTIHYDQFSSDYLTTKVWASTNQGQHCHAEYDNWFSRYLGLNCRLVYFGEQTSRQIKNDHRHVGFADGYPALLISEASLADLNSRSHHHHLMSQFRPNIVIKNVPPFAEDQWQRIRIGEVEFEVNSPCSRCIFTTVNPFTSEQDKDGEPLTVLAQYRQGADSKLYFGQNLIPLNEGVITIDDEVEVLATKESEKYPDSSTIYRPLNLTPTSTQGTHWQSTQPQPLNCIAIHDETPDVKTFVFKQPDDITVNYLAGQFITLNLTIEGQAVNRCYTLSSSPTRPNTLALTIKRKPGGVVSNYLHQHLRVGDTVQAQSPQGIFHSELLTKNKVLLLSAGSGITPMLSILRQAADQASDQDIVFFHSAHTATDLIARQEIELLAKQQGQTQVSYILTQVHGRINQPMLADIKDIGQRTVLLCGPEQFMISAKTQLLALGLNQQQIFQESFGNHPLGDPDASASTATPAIKQNCQLTFTGDNQSLTHQGDNLSSVLEQAEQAGADIRYSCRSGFCGTCKVKLQSGEVQMTEDAALTDTDKQQGYILACSCLPISDIVIQTS